MKTIIVDPQARTVTEAEYNGDYKEIYSLLSYPDQSVNMFDAVRIDNKETIFVDDEGLVNNNGNVHGFFMVKGKYPVMLAGKGVVLSTDEDGDSISTGYSVEQVRDMVLFGHPHLDRTQGRVYFVDTNGVMHSVE